MVIYCHLPLRDWGQHLITGYSQSVIQVGTPFAYTYNTYSKIIYIIYCHLHDDHLHQYHRLHHHGCVIGYLKIKVIIYNSNSPRLLSALL